MIKNLQKIEKQDLSAQTLQVHSIFYTIQGEGMFSGKPAIFIRLAGCNLQCKLCDTDYTSKRTPMMSYDIVAKVFELSGKFKPLVVITGGEPFRQNIAHLVRTLVSKDYQVQIETNGTLFVEGLPWDRIWIVCSPKTGKLNEKLLPHIDAFKYVLKRDSVSPEDGLPLLALDHTASPQVARPPAGNTKPVYLQPADEQDLIKNKRNLKECIASCMHFGYILQMQLHKIVGLE